MESIIKWKTGEPKEEGMYLVTLLDGSVMIDEWVMPYAFNTDEDDVAVWINWDEEVTAWCKLSDI